MLRPDSLLRRFLRLEGAERTLALEAAVLLAYACVVVRWSSGPALVRRLRPEGGRSADALRHRGITDDAAQGVGPATSPPPEAARIAGMVARVASVHPFRPVCLERALAGKWLLARHGHASRVVIGVKTPVFGAHAWVELARDGSPEGLPHTQVEPNVSPANALTSAAGYEAIWRA